MTMTAREIEEVIRSCDSFVSLTIAERFALAQQAEVVRVHAGQLLFRQDEHADGIYIVVEGEMTMIAPGRPTVEALGMFGEVGFYPGVKPRRRADALAEVNTTLVFITYSAFTFQMIGRMAEDLDERLRVFSLHGREPLLPDQDAGSRGNQEAS